jgi:hypothetical protein
LEFSIEKGLLENQRRIKKASIYIQKLKNDEE